MTIQAKPVRGSVKILRCGKCEMDFPIFDFEVESDADAIGLYSAGECGGDKLLLIDLDLEEWKSAQAGGMRELPPRLLRLAGQGYRLWHVLRVEKPPLPSAGFSFGEFRQQYKAPTVVYACPCCDDGEATMRSEMTPNDYMRAGGQIIAVEPLVLMS
jgi:hypothetical protein